MREVLLQGVDAFSDEFDDAFVAAQVFVRESCNALALGPFLEGGEIGYDERRDEFALVSNDDGLFEVAVDGEFALDELWGDVLSVRGLEEVLDAFGNVELSVLDISGIASLEPTVGGECCQCFGGLVVVSRRDGRTFDKYFALFADFYFHSR